MRFYNIITQTQPQTLSLSGWFGSEVEFLHIFIFGWFQRNIGIISLTGKAAGNEEAQQDKTHIRKFWSEYLYSMVSDIHLLTKHPGLRTQSS